MILSTLQKLLDNKGFDTVLNDTLQASKEVGNRAFEISVDSGGGCLVVIKKKIRIENQEIGIKGKSVPIVSETIETKTFRVQLDLPSDFDMIEKEISRG